MSIQDNEHTYYRVFNYINVPMEVKKQNKTMFLYLFSTIAVLKHMSLKENKVQFRRKKKYVSASLSSWDLLFSQCDKSNAN